MSLQQGNITWSSMYFPAKENREIEIHPLPSCCHYNFLIEMSYEVQQQNNFYDLNIGSTEARFKKKPLL